MRRSHGGGGGGGSSSGSGGWWNIREKGKKQVKEDGCAFKCVQLNEMVGVTWNSNWFLFC